MALFPPEYLDTVVALGQRDGDGTLQFTGTGFLYGHPLKVDPTDGQTRFQTFLVTNRHVVIKATGRLVARVNGPIGSTPSEFDLPLLQPDEGEMWTFHPEGADVAVVKVSASFLREQGRQFQIFLKDKTTMSRHQAMELGLSEGSGVFVLGFPMQLVGNERSFVIVRKGIVARVQDWLHGYSTEFLIDAFVFPGNSGGPVITVPELVHIVDTKSVSTSSLIGMVSRYIPYQDVAISPQTERPRVSFEENSGLVEIVPVDMIQETIELAMSRTDSTGDSGASQAETP